MKEATLIKLNEIRKQLARKLTDSENRDQMINKLNILIDSLIDARKKLIDMRDSELSIKCTSTQIDENDVDTYVEFNQRNIKECVSIRYDINNIVRKDDDNYVDGIVKRRIII